MILNEQWDVLHHNRIRGRSIEERLGARADQRVG